MKISSVKTQNKGNIQKENFSDSIKKERIVKLGTLFKSLTQNQFYNKEASEKQGL